MCLRTSGSRNINQLERAVIYSLIFAYSYAITLKVYFFVFFLSTFCLFFLPVFSFSWFVFLRTFFRIALGAMHRKREEKKVIFVWQLTLTKANLICLLLFCFCFYFFSCLRILCFVRGFTRIVTCILVALGLSYETRIHTYIKWMCQSSLSNGLRNVLAICSHACECVRVCVCIYFMPARHLSKVNSYAFYCKFRCRKKRKENALWAYA